MNDMLGLGLVCGHLVGEYVLQNDWMARWKTAPRGLWTQEEQDWLQSLHGDVRLEAMLGSTYTWANIRPAVACTLHCLFYTLAVWAFSFWWMPWWGLVVCFLIHWPIDRFRLAGRWMRNVSGQKDFAGGVFAPWSVIVVDNTWHVVTLFWIAFFVLRV